MILNAFDAERPLRASHEDCSVVCVVSTTLKPNRQELDYLSIVAWHALPGVPFSIRSIAVDKSFLDERSNNEASV
jgi:hypothetical protein